MSIVGNPAFHPVLFPNKPKEQQTSSKIEVASCTLADLMAATEYPLPGTSIMGTLSIPEYQRPYVWAEKQLNKMLRDLTAYLQTGDAAPFYYLGSIILHQAKGQLNIIDGQQRITTLCLLQSLSDATAQFPMRYAAPLSIQRIQQNIRYLRSQEQPVPAIPFYRINITLVVTNNEDDAYRFFETQNTGGKRLSGADIIKSHHLRAVDTPKLAGAARKWEAKSAERMAYVITLLGKARRWNTLFWQPFPSYRAEAETKSVLVTDFTDHTRKEKANISFVQAEIDNDGLQSTVRFTGSGKSVRQPLYDGDNFIDYVTEALDVYETLFVQDKDPRVAPQFYAFRKALVHGHNGTVFLKECFELFVLAYVSKFGLRHLYEFALWCFRFVYALRVTREKTVREDGLVAYVRNTQMLDKIMACFTYDEVISMLQEYSYSFDDNNTGTNNRKGRYIQTLGDFFTPHFNREINTESFDKRLKDAIHAQLKNVQHH